MRSYKTGQLSWKWFKCGHGLVTTQKNSLWFLTKNLYLDYNAASSLLTKLTEEKISSEASAGNFWISA